MRNTIYTIYRQAVLDECATFSLSCYHGCLGAVRPILCYGTLWPDQLRVWSAAMVPYCLPFQKLVSSLNADEECAEILLEAWYFDDGASWLLPMHVCVLHLIEQLGPALGLHVNLANCELFSRKCNVSFLPDVLSPAHATWTSLVFQLRLPTLF